MIKLTEEDWRDLLHNRMSFQRVRELCIPSGPIRIWSSRSEGRWGFDYVYWADVFAFLRDRQAPQWVFDEVRAERVRQALEHL